MANRVHNFYYHKLNFLPNIKNHQQKCLCGFWFHSRSFRAVGSFRKWEEQSYKKFLKSRKKHAKNSIKLVEKCNSRRKGSKFIKNTPGYVIEVKNATKWFVNKSTQKCNQVLHNVNLKVKEGDFVVILGHSGSGKSTLLNVLSGIERPSNGSVVVADHNLIAMSKRELTLFRKDNLSFIFQNYSFFPDLTVKENIISGAELQDNVTRRLDIDELVKLLDIEEHMNKYPRQLSGGQQQRVAIVKSLVKNPKILFADEPTAAVDAETSKNILQMFCDINRIYKTTIVLITHNPEISHLANRKIYIDNGRIVQCIKQTPTPLDKLRFVNFHHEDQ